MVFEGPWPWQVRLTEADAAHDARTVHYDQDAFVLDPKFVLLPVDDGSWRHQQQNHHSPLQATMRQRNARGEYE
jgi:hypothetical protein